MTLFLGILSFIVILAILILVHELGHFTMAKLFRVRVDEFGIGFPPRLRTWRRGHTVYSLNAIPLGGFVKMLGENGEDLEPDSFGAKPQWQRFVILCAGPGMNLLLAVFIAFVAFSIGAPRGLTVITEVSPGSPAALAGLHAGDRVVRIDGHPVKYLSDLQDVVVNDVDNHPGQWVSLAIQRGSRVIHTGLVPRINPPADQGPIGITLMKTVTVRYSPPAALVHSVQQLGTMVASVPLILQSLTHGGEGLSGPIGIAHTTTTAVQNEPSNGIGSIFNLVAILSAGLGVLNLLPFPALDGGRIVFVLISWIRRRNLDPQLEGVVHLAGMAALLLLVVFISYRDLLNWVAGKPF